MEIFERAQHQGLIGRATSAEREWRHAAEVARELGDPGESRCLDLGTGGGLPGLVLASCWPATTWVFVDRRRRSETLVAWAIEQLGIGERATFRLGEAASLAREPALAGSFGLVVARAFGPPAVTVECATGFLGVGSRLVVTEPAGGDPARWPAKPLGRLGLAVGRTATAPRFVQIVKVAPQEARFPRRTAAMQREPLY
ncbi:MAG: class I SAM-dependent methyltransferase [bacterium]|nr:class I SAM-dependent methyltransferase [bacterium]